MLKSRLLIPLMFIFAHPALAHEFWLEPLDFTLDSGQEMVIEIHVGQDFKGNTYSFNPSLFYDFSLTDSTGKTAIEGRLGDMPAVQMSPENDGLQVLNHFSTTMRLTYEDDGKFESFIKNKGLDWVLDKHIERGLPAFGFSEGYTRFAKSLVAVNGGAGRDIRTGMPFELLALANPYIDDLSAGLPIMLFFNETPIADIQIDIFHRAQDGEVTKTHVITGPDGRSIIPLSGNGTYMLNAVHMIIPSEVDIENTGAVWHSLWASLTFEITNP